MLDLPVVKKFQSMQCPIEMQYCPSAKLSVFLRAFGNVTFHRFTTLHFMTSMHVAL